MFKNIFTKKKEEKELEKDIIYEALRNERTRLIDEIDRYEIMQAKAYNGEYFKDIEGTEEVNKILFKNHTEILENLQFKLSKVNDIITSMERN